MEEFIQNRLKRIVELDEKRDEQQALWLRQILTLAAGALAILAGLGPAAPTEGPAKYFLSATWASLGIGIVSGAAATYLAVSHANKTANTYRAQFNKDIENKTQSKGFIHVPRNKWLARSMPVMIFSLLAAVLCLAAYAIVVTLEIGIAQNASLPALSS